MGTEDLELIEVMNRNIKEMCSIIEELEERIEKLEKEKPHFLSIDGACDVTNHFPANHFIGRCHDGFN